MAIAQLRSQRLKAAFMASGVTIAVAFLIALVSILKGMQIRMDDALAAHLQTHTFRVSAGQKVNSYADYMAEARGAKAQALTDADAVAIGAALPAGARWAAVNMLTANIALGSAVERSGYVSAVRGDFFAMGSSTIGHGRPFTPVEDALGARVAAIDSASAAAAFPGLNPLGRSLRVAGVVYAVVAVLAPDDWPHYSGSTTLYAIVPLHSPAGARGAGQVVEIDVRVARLEDIGPAQDRVRQVLRVRRQLRPRMPDDFQMWSTADYISYMVKPMHQIELMTIILPLVGILVGALVITNIMLVAVAERVREIGVRKALGARRRDVLLQFLVESTTLSTIGAAIGVAAGIAIPLTITWFNPKFPSAIAPWSIGMGIALGVSVGIVAGVYPAMRAARLEPIRALRQEQ